MAVNPTATVQQQQQPPPQQQQQPPQKTWALQPWAWIQESIQSRTATSPWIHPSPTSIPTQPTLQCPTNTHSTTARISYAINTTSPTISPYKCAHAIPITK
eukprot:8640122-Ditylum_brightwellii.AAC.1